jgi:putative heme-binding domain-containing protein
MVRSSLGLFLFAAAAQAVPEGFVIREFLGNAQEPEIYPTAVSAAANGDVYVSSDKNGSLGHVPGMGRILIARDTKGAGVADQVIEYTKVESPRGGHFVGGVLYLVHPPFLSRFQDKNGDGKADYDTERTLLVDGLGGGIEHPRGADHTTNGARMGIDGWLYIAVGDFGAGIIRDNDGAIGLGDKKRVTLYGGGVMRVRPDGTELENYTVMTRNICDVAISPTLDLFSRDNTNDGKGWNTRFHHFTSLADAGYPRLYKNFADEIAHPLADYGGGSGTGGLYLSEPGFPGDFGESLFTCDWTTGTLHRHPITRFEATFVAKQETFEKVARATDFDVDGNSRLFLSDWRGGGFSYLGNGKPKSKKVMKDGKEVEEPIYYPNGTVQLITAKDVKPNVYVDVTKLSDADLVKQLSSKSAVQRLETQRQIIDRNKAELGEPVLAIARSGSEHLYSRVAAIFTYKQLLGAKANAGLVALAKDAAVREFALRALADRTTQLEGVPVQLFVDALNDADPRVRLQALIGLQRLGAKEAAPAILAAAAKWPADESKLGEGEHYRLPHTAIAALARLGNAKACIAALADPAQRFVAFRALQGIHTDEAVDGLLALSLSGDDEARFGAVTTLARLYHVEKPWNYKDWWSTRPDDRGPYFTPDVWSATPRIHKGIEAAYAKLPGKLRMASLEILAKNRIAITDLKLEGLDPLRLAMASQTLRPADVVLLTEAAIQGKLTWKEKIDCFKALRPIDIAQGDKGDPYFPNRLKILGAWAKDAAAPGEAIQMVNEFIYDSERFKQVGKLRALADGADDATSTILWKALFNVLNSPLSKPDQKKQVQNLVNKNPRDLGFFHAITDLGLTGFDKQLEEGMKGDNVIQIKAAQAALDSGKKALARKGKKIAQLDLAEVSKAVLKGRGNVKQGQQLYTKQGCVACHAIDLTAEQKGPYLGASGAKFPREYLVESVLYPNKVVAQGFQTVQFDLKDGGVQMGFVTGEADGVVTLRNIAGQVFKIKRADVKAEKHLPQSMMPEGLAAGLTVEELTSLIEYLGTLKSIGG